MMIVASNSLTVSNVNDGTITHLAYSWSADGTDRFTTVYPGENLLLNSDQQFTNSTVGQEFVATTFNLNDIFDKYGTDQVYTISYDLSSKDPSKVSWIQAYPFPGTTPQNKYSFPIVRHQGITTAPQRFSMTFKPTLVDETITKTTLVFYGEYDSGNIPIVNRIKVALGNEGNIAYTPSPLDDPEGAYPKFIGTYTDYTVDDSTDPSKYTWTKLRGEQGPKGDTGADGISPINLVIESSNGYQFKNNIINTTFTAKLYQDNKEIDKDGTQYAYVWSKVNSDGTVDTAWNIAHQTSQKSITITNRDIWKRATFNCAAEQLN